MLSHLFPCWWGPLYDINGDGYIDQTDANIVVANTGNALEGIPASGVGNPYAFTDRRMDFFDSDDLLLYHYRAREYDPHHGRFMQRDPSRYVDGMNLYEYAVSNPLKYVDWTGMWPMHPPNSSIVLPPDLLPGEDPEPGDATPCLNCCGPPPCCNDCGDPPPGNPPSPKVQSCSRKARKKLIKCCIRHCYIKTRKYPTGIGIDSDRPSTNQELPTDKDIKCTDVSDGFDEDAVNECIDKLKNKKYSLTRNNCCQFVHKVFECAAQKHGKKDPRKKLYKECTKDIPRKCAMYDPGGYIIADCIRREKEKCAENSGYYNP